MEEGVCGDECHLLSAACLTAINISVAAAASGRPAPAGGWRPGEAWDGVARADGVAAPGPYVRRLCRAPCGPAGRPAPPPSALAAGWADEPFRPVRMQPAQQEPMQEQQRGGGSRSSSSGGSGGSSSRRRQRAADRGGKGGGGGSRKGNGGA